MAQTVGITDFSSQRPAIDIRPQALTRHVTFRLPFETNPRFEVEDEARKERWEGLCRHLARHVHALRKRHHPDGDPHPVDFIRPTSEVFKDPLRFTLDRTAVIPITAADERRYRMRVRVDVYTEICSLTYIIDSIAADCPHLAEHLSDIEAAESIPGDRAVFRAKEEALNWLYDDVWSLDSPIEAAKTAQAHFASERDRLGVPLTDFRGIVLDTSDEPGKQGPKELRPSLKRFLQNNDNLVHIAAGRHPAMKQTSLSGEPVCCGMLDGSAVYVAELGRRNPQVRVEPVRHLLVFAGSSESQVGRLVRRLHVLGEFRHAALLDYDNEDDIDLKRVSRTLHALGREVDKVFLATPRERIEEMPGLIAKLSELRANAAETGALYRIEQSRYYAGEFRGTLRHLRSIRIESWQTYDDFVARYIYQLFARIDRVGSRYDALMRRLGLLTTFSLATEISGYQIKVTKALGSLERATERLGQAAANQISVSEKQRSLLDEASIIAMAFLSYYIASVFDHLFEIDPADGYSGHEFFYMGSMAVTGALAAVSIFLMARRILASRKTASPSDPADSHSGEA